MRLLVKEGQLKAAKRDRYTVYHVMERPGERVPGAAVTTHKHR